MRRTPASLRPWRSSIRARIVIACAALFLVPGAILTGVAYTQIGHVLVIQSGPQGEVSSRQGNVTYFNDTNNPQISATRDASKQRGFLAFALAGLGLGTLLRSLRFQSTIGSVGLQLSRLDAIVQETRKHLVDNLIAQCRVFDGKGKFDPPVKISWHPIRTGKEHSGLTGILEIENSAVF